MPSPPACRARCLKISELEGKRLAIWGYGREGRAALAALRWRLPGQPITVFCNEQEAASLRAMGDPHLTAETEVDGPKLAAKDIRARVLVIHGTSDPIFPIEHGQAFADALPKARLVTIPGGGHELHEQDWPVMIDAIVAHTDMA